MGKFVTSGAEAPRKSKPLFAAPKRCATQKLKHCATQNRNHGKISGVMQRLCAVLTTVALAGFCCIPGLAQNASQMPAAAPGPGADVIFIHANVYTGVPANAQFSSILREEAIAVRGDRIQAVGKNADIAKLKGPQTQVIDLVGRFVMPGFNDAHLHLADAGLKKLNVDLTGVKNLDEFRARIQAKVKTARSDEWILGGGWDETMWRGQALPNRWDLDEISEGHPVFLDRVDWHLAVANKIG